VFDPATLVVKAVNDMQVLLLVTLDALVPRTRHAWWDHPVLTTHPMGLWQAIQLMRNVCGIE
jgi:hypothetical protein